MAAAYFILDDPSIIRRRSPNLNRVAWPPKRCGISGSAMRLPDGRRSCPPLPAKAFRPTRWVTCGLALKNAEGSTYDRFRDRIIFSLTDLSGRVIGFAGRGLEANATPKYLNSPGDRSLPEKRVSLRPQHLPSIYQTGEFRPRRRGVHGFSYPVPGGHPQCGGNLWNLDDVRARPPADAIHFPRDSGFRRR